MMSQIQGKRMALCDSKKIIYLCTKMQMFLHVTHMCHNAR